MYFVIITSCVWGRRAAGLIGPRRLGISLAAFSPSPGGTPRPLPSLPVRSKHTGQEPPAKKNPRNRGPKARVRVGRRSPGPVTWDPGMDGLHVQAVHGARAHGSTRLSTATGLPSHAAALHHSGETRNTSNEPCQLARWNRACPWAPTHSSFIRKRQVGTVVALQPQRCHSCWPPSPTPETAPFSSRQRDQARCLQPGQLRPVGDIASSDGGIPLLPRPAACRYLHQQASLSTVYSKYSSQWLPLCTDTEYDPTSFFGAEGSSNANLAYPAL